MWPIRPGQGAMGDAYRNDVFAGVVMVMLLLLAGCLRESDSMSLAWAGPPGKAPTVL